MKLSTTQRVKRSRIYAMTRDIKWRLENYVSQDERRRFRVLSLAPKGPSKGDVLFSRLNRAFFLNPGGAIPPAHQNLWESYQMAMIFLELGYSVDVIDYTNNSFIPRKDYSIFLDVKWNMERIGPLLNKECIKVLHAVTANPLFQNAAEMHRLLALQQRRGVTLRPRRQDWLNWAIENADCATVLGNEFTLSTYRYAGKPMYSVPLASPTSYEWPKGKDFDRCRKDFLFFAGAGMVHKGLDLILEAFAGMPEASLTVCGPVEKETDFVAAFHRELYETENIHTVGWIDSSSAKFVEITNGCVALIHASCSESGCASVITGMHAGLIPIVSYESSVDVYPSFGVVLNSASVEDIRDAVRLVANLEAPRLEEMARTAWQQARQRYSPENFTAEYKRAIDRILSSAHKSCTSPGPEVAFK